MQASTRIAECVHHPCWSVVVADGALQVSEAVAHHHRNASRVLVLQQAALVEYIIVVSVILSLKHGASFRFHRGQHLTAAEREDARGKLVAIFLIAGFLVGRIVAFVVFVFQRSGAPEQIEVIAEVCGNTAQDA
jgi:H+/Cl- antiporter ClcA